jgi:hypothetical protein
MRQSHLKLAQELQASIDRKVASDHGDLSQSMDFWVDHGGARAAAWLVWLHRRQFHRAGAVDFKIPRSAPTPPWMRVALETLKRRAGKWEVQHVGGLHDREKAFRVVWVPWAHYRRPEELRQPS